MFQIDLKDLLIVLLIHVVVPISWVTNTPFLPRAVQTLTIVFVLSIIFFFCRHCSLFWTVVLIGFGYIVTTFLSNLLVANLFGSRMF